MRLELMKKHVSIQQLIFWRRQSTGTITNNWLFIDFKKVILKSRYWQLKKEMADGSEPTNIRQILHHFSDITCGMSLCGAGAGGFAVLILKADKSKEDLFQRIKTWNSKSNDKLCWYSTSVDFTGTDLRVIDDDNVEDIKTFLI